MKIFSFSKSGNSELVKQVTLEVSPNDLRRLSSFFLKCANEIEDDHEWEHEHLSDYLEEGTFTSDLVVFNSRK